VKHSNLNSSRLEAIREKLIELHYDKKVGHLGGNLSSIDVISLLLHEFCLDPNQLVLSKGHSALALYVALWSSGWLSDSDLRSTLENGTNLPGHPPFDRGDETGIIFGTGSLGHGLSLAAGLALARKFRGDSRRTYCVVSDGELQEGQTMEAIGFSASMRLGELVVVIDGNGLQGFGTTAEVSRGRDVQRLLASFDIELSRVDGHKLEGIREVLLKPSSSKPLFLWLDTVKGHGIVEIEGKLSSHYWPLTIDQFHQRREW